MSYWKQGIKVNEYADDQGKYRMDFECPECQKWSQVIRHERIEAVTFLCKNEECQFEMNSSTKHPEGNAH